MKKRITIFLTLFLMPFMALSYGQLTSPADGAVGVSIQPSVDWTNAGTEIVFTIDDSYVSGTPSHDPDAGEYYYTFASGTNFDMSLETDVLLNNTTYYVWVYESGTTWVEQGSFSTAINVTPTLTSPVAGADLQTPTVMLTWTNNAGGSNYLYDVFVSSTQQTTYAGGTVVFEDLTNTSVQLVENLVPGETFYWQVRVKSAAGAILGYSVVESFVAYGVMSEPVLLYPEDGIETFNTEPYLYWTNYYYNTVIEYQVLYSTDAPDADGGADADIIDGAGTETTDLGHDLYVQLSSLTGGETYYWQVYATNGTDETWSDVWSFATPATTTSGGGTLESPTPTYPIDGVSVYSSSVSFYYQGFSDATLQYQVRYGTDDTDTTPADGEMDAGTNTPLTSNSYVQVANLTGDETYYWQVRTYDGSSYSDWSDIETFDTDVSILNVQTPYLVTPYDNGFASSVNPTVYWRIPGDPNGYTFTAVYNSDGAQETNGNLTYATDETGVILGGSTSTVTTTDGFYAKFYADLTDGETYYWQVIATKGSVTTYSTIYTFTVSVTTVTTSTVPDIPIPVYPTGGHLVYTTDVDVQWVVNGTYSNLEFQVNWSQNDEVDGSGILNNGATETGWTDELSYALTGLTPNAPAYWQVQARNATTLEESDYSSVQYFVIQTGSGVSAAIIGSPAKGTTVKSISPTLSWIIPATTSSSQSYEVEISEDPAMTAAQVIDAAVNNVEVNLEDGKTYYWRVRSKTDDNQYSNYTGKGAFEIDQSITDVETESELPTEFRVSQNYPNPFNPSTTIKFALPASEKVSVKIYDMLGREVATLLNTQLEAGNHQVVWNGQNNYGSIVSTGVYFYRVVSGNNIVVKKMLLMK